ncbi:hypothetical protein ZOSMA_38G00740 [Zostera marina]|uniref:peptidylprolyl isomerase n=1 Tax=Zostera marina TaxID=29655 RepID=A0A0K9P6Z3_ZOSMR|nr:hypothetical protein ZOSMA_38G00740 [Zostera marina]
MAKKKNPTVFLEVSIDGNVAGLLEFELFYDVVPKTAENFRALCTGEKGIGVVTNKPLHYKGSCFHRIIKGFMAQGGDFSKRDGRGGESIYGGKFTDEGFAIKHDSPGLLSMANTGPDSNNSQFFITLKATPHLDGKHVVFGKLVHGREILRDMELVDTDDSNKPLVPVKIVNCGEVHSGKSESLIADKEKRKPSRQKTSVNDSSNDDIRDARRKSKHKKSSRLKKKKRKRYYSSDTESSSLDSDTESSESDSDSDSYSSSSSSELSSSSDDHRRRKRHSKRDRYKRSKKRRERRKVKKRRRRERRKRRSRRLPKVNSENVDTSGSSSEDDGDDASGKRKKIKVSSQTDPHSSMVKNESTVGKMASKEDDFLSKNGEMRMNGNIIDDEPGKSGDKVVENSIFQVKARDHHPKQSVRNRISVSPKVEVSKSPSISANNLSSRSPSSRSPSKSPIRPSANRSRSKSLSKSPLRPPGRSVSRGSMRSLSHKSDSQSPLRPSFRRAVNRSPLRAPQRSPSRSLSPVRRSPSRSLSPVRRSPPRRLRSRKSLSRSLSPVRRASPVVNRRRSPSRSESPDGSPKRIRRGRGFSQRYSYARRYRTRSPDRSPIRSYRYGRNERDRYPNYRGYSERSPPRRYRSSPRARTPPRYRGRRSPSRSLSRSPLVYRNRTRRGYSRSPPPRSVSPSERRRSRVTNYGRSNKRTISRSRDPSGSRSRSSSPVASPSPKRISKDKLGSSPSTSPDGKKGLVSYGDGSP